MSPPPPPPPAEVLYVSTSTIKPSYHPNSTQQHIHLTPWDLSLLPLQTIQKGLLFIKPKHKPKPKQESSSSEEEQHTNLISIINHLKTSFSQALDHFYPFSGKLSTTLHKHNNTVSVYIDCNNNNNNNQAAGEGGAQFIHAKANITLSDFLNPTYIPHIVNSFFPLNGTINYDGRFQPLISVQVTELIDGFFIGCSVNHTVCDGTSFWHFFNSWSEISRSCHTHIPSSSPNFKRWFFKETDSPIRLPSCLIDDERFRHCHVHVVPSLPCPLIEQRVFHFSRENLERLKAKANSQSWSESNHHIISSLQALLAHFWVAVTKARCLDSYEETTYRLLIGNRARLDPPLPQEYFGNSILFGTATAKAGELLKKGIGLGGLLLNQMIKSYTDKSIRSCWESWMEKPELLFPNGGVKCTNPNTTLVTGSSPRFNMYGNDFGWGRPIAVRSGCANKRDGRLTVYPGAVEGSIDIEAALSPETLKALGDDAEFMEDVTILPPFRIDQVSSIH